MTKSTIPDAVKKLLVAGSANTQDGIKQHLSALGFEVNQAMISRLLRKLGAIKTNNTEGQTVYRLPKEPTPPQSNTMLAYLVLDITHNENVIVIHTSPGSASLFGRLIDHNLSKLNVLGTIAGDDTLLVIPQSVQQIESVIAQIKLLLSIHHDRLDVDEFADAKMG